MICSCQVYCRSKTEREMEDMGITADAIPGIWLPFTFMYEYVTAIKSSGNDPDEEVYNCTTVYMENGDAFVIDVPYDEVLSEWTAFLNLNQ